MRWVAIVLLIALPVILLAMLGAVIASGRRLTKIAEQFEADRVEFITSIKKAILEIGCISCSNRVCEYPNCNNKERTRL